jgi:hypothetical protein
VPDRGTSLQGNTRTGCSERALQNIRTRTADVNERLAAVAENRDASRHAGTESHRQVTLVDPRRDSGRRRLDPGSVVDRYDAGANVSARRLRRDERDERDENQAEGSDLNPALNVRGDCLAFRVFLSGTRLELESDEALVANHPRIVTGFD